MLFRYFYWKKTVSDAAHSYGAVQAYVFKVGQSQIFSETLKQRHAWGKNEHKTGPQTIPTNLAGLLFAWSWCINE